MSKQTEQGTHNENIEDLSFLNLHVLHKNKINSSPEISSRDDFQKSSESNETSSESEGELLNENNKTEGIEDVSGSHHSIEKSNKGMSAILAAYLPKEQNFTEVVEQRINTSRLLKKIALPPFDALILYIAAVIKEKEDDIQVLGERMSLRNLDYRISDDKIDQIIRYILGTWTRSDKSFVSGVFAEHSTIFLSRVLEDKKLNEDISFDGYLNKPLVRVNLKLFAIYYTEKLSDYSIIKKFMLLVQQTTNEYYELLKVFIRFKANNLARETFKALADSNFIFDSRILNFTLAAQNLECLWFLANSNRRELLSSWLNEEQTQKSLIEQLYSAEGKSFEYLLYFLKKVRRIKSKQTIKRLAETVIHRINTSREGQFLFTFYNPLKVSLLVIELMKQTISTVMHHKNKLNKALDLYYKFAMIYCSLIPDDRYLIDLFKDTDLERRKTIYMIEASNSGIITSNQIVEDAIELLWNGSMAPKTNLFQMFTVTQNLFFEELSEYEIERKSNKNDIFMALNQKHKTHHFAFQRIVWTHSCRIRNQIDQWLILILMIMVISNFNDLFIPVQKIQELVREYNFTYDESFYEEEQKYVDQIERDYIRIQLVFDLIIGINFAFKPIFIRYYDWTYELQTKFNAQDYLAFFLGVASLIQSVLITSAKDLEEPYRYTIFVHTRWVYMTLVIFQIIHSLKNFKVFGPMIRALWLVVLECAKLSFIFILVTLLFGFMAYFSFYENANQRMATLGNALLFLVEATFGQFSFADFDQPSPIFAPIFLNIYLFFSPIIFMQLLVAVLTFTFENASKNGRVSYYLGMIGNIRNLEFDVVCGCLVTVPIIGNFINLIFFLTQLLSDPDPALKEKNIDFLKKVNRVIVKGSYYPIYIALTAISIIIVICCSPLFYVVKLFRIIFESSNKEKGYSKSKRIFKWMFLGFYYMTAATIQDLKENYTYLMHGRFLNDSSPLSVSNSTFLMVAQSAKENFFTNGEKQPKILFSEFLESVLKKVKEQNNLEKQAKLNNPSTKQLVQTISSTFSPLHHQQKQNNNNNNQERNIKSSNKFFQNQISINDQTKDNLIQDSPKAKNEIQLKSINQESEIRCNQRQMYFTNRINSLLAHEEEQEDHTTPISSKRVNLSFQKRNSTFITKNRMNFYHRRSSAIFNKSPKHQQIGVKSFLIEPQETNIEVELSPPKIVPSTSKQEINMIKDKKEEDPEIKEIQLFRKREVSFIQQQEDMSNLKQRSKGSIHSEQNKDPNLRRKGRKQTAHQIFRKIQQRESNIQLIKESDVVYQFIDQFVIDEEEHSSHPKDTQKLSKKEREKTNQNDWVMIENMLKLMYYYNKNDIKLVRFNILFQAIKKLFKEE